MSNINFDFAIGNNQLSFHLKQLKLKPLELDFYVSKIFLDLKNNMCNNTI